MDIYEIENCEFTNIKKGKQNMIVLQNVKIENNKYIILKDKIDKTMINCQITGVNEFSDVESICDVIPYKLLGVFNSKIEAINKIKSKILNNNATIYVYRIKTNIEKYNIDDLKLNNIISIDNIEEINIGRSVSRIFKTTMKENNKACILKVQELPSRISLKEEYEKIKWLQGKINCPQIYYWNEECGKKYLLMEFKEGVPSFKYSNIGYQLGVELKKFHSIKIEDCKFTNNSVENLLSNCLVKIDAILPEINRLYPNESKSSVIEFLINNKPTDQVIVHGDYSLPNILINDKLEYNFIDLGDVSISTMYFDFYYFIRSLKINKKTEQLEEFLKGYGVEKLDSKYLKWMDIIDKSLY